MARFPLTLGRRWLAHGLMHLRELAMGLPELGLEDIVLIGDLAHVIGDAGPDAFEIVEVFLRALEIGDRIVELVALLDHAADAARNLLPAGQNLAAERRRVDMGIERRRLHVVALRGRRDLAPAPLRHMPKEVDPRALPDVLT